MLFAPMSTHLTGIGFRVHHVPLVLKDRSVCRRTFATAGNTAHCCWWDGARFSVRTQRSSEGSSVDEQSDAHGLTTSEPQPTVCTRRTSECSSVDAHGDAQGFTTSEPTANCLYIPEV